MHHLSGPSHQHPIMAVAKFTPLKSVVFVSFAMAARPVAVARAGKTWCFSLVLARS